jgi:hypothetical protein
MTAGAAHTSAVSKVVFMVECIYRNVSFVSFIYGSRRRRLTPFITYIGGGALEHESEELPSLRTGT